MSAQPVVLSGPAAIKAARKLALASQMRDQWPYPWLFPPPNAEDIFVAKSIPAPANNSITEILAYQVPSSYVFVMTHLVQMYTGVQFTNGSGDALWTLDVNFPIQVNPPLQGSRIQGFQSVDVALGSNVIPWPLAKPRIFKSLDTIRSKVITTNVIIPGSGNFFTSIFIGWIWPASE